MAEKENDSFILFPLNEYQRLQHENEVWKHAAEKTIQENEDLKHKLSLAARENSLVVKSNKFAQRLVQLNTYHNEPLFEETRPFSAKTQGRSSSLPRSRSQDKPSPVPPIFGADGPRRSLTPSHHSQDNELRHSQTWQGRSRSAMSRKLNRKKNHRVPSDSDSMVTIEDFEQERRLKEMKKNRTHGEGWQGPGLQSNRSTRRRPSTAGIGSHASMDTYDREEREEMKRTWMRPFPEGTGKPPQGYFGTPGIEAKEGSQVSSDITNTASLMSSTHYSSLHPSQIAAMHLRGETALEKKLRNDRPTQLRDTTADHHSNVSGATPVIFSGRSHNPTSIITDCIGNVPNNARRNPPPWVVQKSEDRIQQNTTRSGRVPSSLVTSKLPALSDSKASSRVTETLPKRFDAYSYGSKNPVKRPKRPPTSKRRPLDSLHDLNASKNIENPYVKHSPSKLGLKRRDFASREDLVDYLSNTGRLDLTKVSK